MRTAQGGHRPGQHRGTEPHHSNLSPTHPLQWDWDTHHPHFGEVHQAILGVIRGPLLNERQVGQVHSQVGDTGRVTTSGANQKQIRKENCLTMGLWSGEKGQTSQLAEFEGFSPQESCWSPGPHPAATIPTGRAGQA